MVDDNLKVFICYAREDEEAAMRLYFNLKGSNISAWIDKKCLLPGQNWKIAIKQAIRKCRYFIAILSTNSVGKRGFVQRELYEALEMLSEFPESDVFIIPVRLDECQPSHEKLNDLHWADMFPKWEDGLNKILSLLKNEVLNETIKQEQKLESIIEKQYTKTTQMPNPPAEEMPAEIKIEEEFKATPIGKESWKQIEETSVTRNRIKDFTEKDEKIFKAIYQRALEKGSDIISGKELGIDKEDLADSLEMLTRYQYVDLSLSALGGPITIRITPIGFNAYANRYDKTKYAQFGLVADQIINKKSYDSNVIAESLSMPPLIIRLILHYYRDIGEIRIFEYLNGRIEIAHVGVGLKRGYQET